MKLKIAANCIRGNKRRSNEDMVLVGESFLRDGSIDFSLDNPDLFFALVSDGMGGHDHGEMASEFLLRRIREEIQPGTDVGTAFQSWIRSVNAEMECISSEMSMKRHMGCTLSGLIWQNDRVWIVNAGDSRTYRFRSGSLLQLTEDHNIKQRPRYNSGPELSMLVNCIGAGAAAQVDINDVGGDIQSGDIFLICTDGLYEMLPERNIQEVLSGESGPVDSVARLSQMAEEAGGRDNISLIVVKLV